VTPHALGRRGLLVSGPDFQEKDMSTDTATTPADAETLPFRYNATLAGAIERRW